MNRQLKQALRSAKLIKTAVCAYAGYVPNKQQHNNLLSAVRRQRPAVAVVAVVAVAADQVAAARAAAELAAEALAAVAHPAAAAWPRRPRRWPRGRRRGRRRSASCLRGLTRPTLRNALTCRYR